MLTISRLSERLMKTKERITEARLQGFCARYFSSQGFLTQEEVPFLFKVADLFCFHEGTGQCIAVEVKVKNWRAALAQALIYQMMADKVYIALHDEQIKAVNHDVLALKGVGLLAVSTLGKVAITLEAPQSPWRMDYFVSKVVATVFPGRGSLGCLML